MRRGAATQPLRFRNFRIILKAVKTRRAVAAGRAPAFGKREAMQLTRRRFLTGLTAGAATLWLGACGGSA
ncbi:MAG: twin-arginine translocation signal domain-containing protein, partial [Chloroflexota bacterium]|nr:twin-arginine translocation signal domain-containing protein [Chloroflexota bacterium]